MAYQTFDGDQATTTIADVKAWMRPRLKKGVVCPCCKKKSKVYTRKLTYLMAVPLIIGWRSAGIGEWISFQDLLAPLVSDEDVGKWFTRIQTSYEWPKLRHWQLVVPEPGRRKDGNKKGRFAITALGEKFVKGEVSVPSHYYEFQRENVGWMWLEDEEIKYITVVDALGTKFNWKDLMP